MATRTIILNFHGVGEPARPLEPGEELYWIEEAFFCDILALLESRDGGDPVTITFDDGNASDLDICAPILAKRGRQATFFVLAGRLGRPGSLSAEGLRQLAAAGHRIGTHGFDHVVWRGLDPATSRREIVEARKLLEDAIGDQIREAAIPFGAYDRGVLKRLRAAAYDHVHTSDGGRAYTGAWLRPRISVRKDMSLDHVTRLVSERDRPLRHLRRRLAMAKKRLF